jgi:hypothetical protein
MKVDQTPSRILGVEVLSHKGNGFKQRAAIKNRHLAIENQISMFSTWMLRWSHVQAHAALESDLKSVTRVEWRERCMNGARVE